MVTGQLYESAHAQTYNALSIQALYKNIYIA